MYSSFSRAMRRFSLVLGALSGAGTALLMLTVVPDLVARTFFGDAIYGMAETGIFLLVLIVFLALAAAQVKKEHFHVGILDAALSGRAMRWVWAGRFALSAVVTGVFAWYATQGAIASTLSLEQSYAVIEYPIWPARITVAFGLALLALQFLLDTIDALVDPESVPKAALVAEGESAGA